jgi:Protein of unknown function (DUF3631)
MRESTPETDPYRIDPLLYLTSINGNSSPIERLEHYYVLRPVLRRLHQHDPAAFDLAVQEITRRLKIKARTVIQDLATLADPAAPKEARELLEAMGHTRQLRLAQDFLDGLLWFGVIAGEEILLLNSARELLKLDQLPPGLTVKNHGFDRCRLSKDAILRFLRADTPADAQLLVDLQRFFSRFAAFRDPRVPLLLATWTLGTYAYRLFRVFPYLALRSPEKRCGKSRVLDLLALVAFNASSRVVHPTEAQLFRGPSRNGGTLLLDEVEALGRANKELYAGVLAVLNSGCEQGGSVSRFERTMNGQFQEVSFDTYCPRAIAGIKTLAETLEDRAIIVVMQRKLATEKTDRFSPTRLDALVQGFRDRCYLWALTHVRALDELYEAADRVFPSLDALDDRARDLWEPLVVFTAVIDRERGDTEKPLTTALSSLARDLCSVRDSEVEHSTTARVVQALWDVVEEQRTARPTSDVIVSPSELAVRVAAKLGWEKLSPKTLATLLNPLGFASKSTREEGARGRRYHLHIDTVKDLLDRYGEGPLPQGESS